MAISASEKELVAVAISVASGCKPCTKYHVKAAREAGATDEAIERAVSGALSVRGRATRIMRDYASALLAGARDQAGVGENAAGTSRTDALVAVGAAFGVNCVSSLERHLALADGAGVSGEEVAEIVALAVFVKERAASHVERLCGVSHGRRRPKTQTAAPGAAASGRSG